MYKGFDLKLKLSEDEIKDHYQTGKSLFNNDRVEVANTLKEFFNSDNSLNGSAIQKAWFPQIKSDVFISHSHYDERTAIAMAGWIWSTFRIKPFVDSCVWGYADELLKLVDNKYCLQGDGYYNYQLRNFSTSHVHMMLSTALALMIDKTECIFFLNTPQSIRPSEGIEKTESPWLYSEIVTTQLIRQSTPDRILKLNESFDGADSIRKSKFMSITYDVDLGHLTRIVKGDLIKWSEKKAMIDMRWIFFTFLIPQSITNGKTLGIYSKHHFKDGAKLFHYQRMGNNTCFCSICFSR